MNYEKPRVELMGSAVEAVQFTLAKDDIPAVDSPTKSTESAYCADE